MLRQENDTFILSPMTRLHNYNRMGFLVVRNLYEAAISDFAINAQGKNQESFSLLIRWSSRCNPPNVTSPLFSYQNLNFTEILGQDLC